MRSGRVGAWLAPLALVAAIARRRPGRWAWPLLGIAVAVTFAGAVAAETVIASDQAARATLNTLSPFDRTVRITWQGPATPAASERARGVLRSLGLGGQSEVTLLDPVRLSGVIVRPVAIAPVQRWLPAAAAGRLGPCRPEACRMVLAGGGTAPSRLRAPGVRIDLAGAAPLESNVPLGFAPLSEGQWPLVLTGDPAGLDRLPALSSVYRVHSWLAALDTAPLHNWDLPRLERRLAGAQAALLQGSTQFAMTAPFDGLDAARAQASAAPNSLLLAGGGAVAALGLFVALAAGALRREQVEDLARLRAGGATELQAGVFIAGEALALCAVALLVGFGGALAAASALAAAAGEPAGAVLGHSLLTPIAGPAVAAGWLVGAGVIVGATQMRDARVLNLVAVAALAGLVAALVLGASDTGSAAALLAPTCCVAAGVVVMRVTTWLLGPAERLVRRRSVTLRLAVVGLARAPGPPAVAIAFVCVAVALGGFALSSRATLARGAADQAADRVPLDSIVAPGPSFITPLELQPLARWRAVSHGSVFPVRRAQASFQAGGGATTEPALGVPVHALTLIHGWRTSDGSAPLAVLARRLAPPGPVRTPGPLLPAGAERLTLAARSPQMAVDVTADLRDRQGQVRRLPLGTASTAGTTLSAALPPGAWELAALELDEGTGLEVTNGHQNGESATPSTQFTAHLELGPMEARGRRGQVVERLPLGGWVGAGAAAATRARATGNISAPAKSSIGAPATSKIGVRFQATGLPGVLRPRQPSDSLPVPVLADPGTAAAAGADRRLQMTVDGQPLDVRVVGVLHHFPTLAGSGSFVVADEAVLAAALDAQLPGQGGADELWIATPHPAALRVALDQGRLTALRATFRADVEAGIRSAPVAKALAGTLLAAAGVAGALALIGLLLVVQGPLRDRRLEEDLAAQGLGPAGIRGELRTRLVVAGLAGIVPGVGLALLLGRLAVPFVGSAATAQPTVPPLVTVLPWPALAAWAVGAAAVVLAVAHLAPSGLIGDVARTGRRRTAPAPAPSDEVLREEWVR